MNEGVNRKGIDMGSVRPLYLKRAAREFIQAYPDKFTTDFNENSSIIDEMLKDQSKTIRNRIAGYITTLMKQNKRV